MAKDRKIKYAIEREKMANGKHKIYARPVK